MEPTPEESQVLAGAKTASRILLRFGALAGVRLAFDDATVELAVDYWSTGQDDADVGLLALLGRRPESLEIALNVAGDWSLVTWLDLERFKATKAGRVAAVLHCCCPEPTSGSKTQGDDRPDEPVGAAGGKEETK